jgi:orotidine-5'-phosphate decarboxylase
MKASKEYIIFPLDVASAEAARSWVKSLRDHVGLFKIGLELFVRTGPSLVEWIVDHSAAGIFLDLKLHDIPATVGNAMAGIAALKPKLATVHCGENRTMLEAAVRSAGGVAVLGVTLLTSVSSDDLRAGGYGAEMADDPGRLVLHRAAMAKSTGCAGVVCSGHEVSMIKSRFGPDFLAVTPGIRPAWDGLSKNDQQRVVTPGMAVAAGADYIVIGRPIREAKDPVAAALRIAEEIDGVLNRRKGNRL